MPIDGCTHTFAKLATEILPRYMRQLEGSMHEPVSMSQFAIKHVGPKSIARKLGLSDDFPGCYVLLTDGVPMYVGISRAVLGRVRQHVLGTSHYDATLAYTMAARRAPHSSTRTDAMADNAFMHAFAAAREELSRCDVAFIRIENAVEMQLFEIYCAMELDTCEWNTFETH
ncbi:MAG: hypothetical protein ACOX2R_00590 [Anaerolineae bacterium]|jgi:hypothetical protein